MSMILYAIESTKDESDPTNTLDGATTTVLQIMVLGLTFTEWMSKLREVSDVTCRLIDRYLVCLFTIRNI